MVKTVDEPSNIIFDWGGGGHFTTMTLRVESWYDEGTYAQITESGLAGTGDELAARAADSTGGFTMVLCSLKALLEHDIVLNAVTDRAPQR